jgi:hypothetical protein
MGQYAHCETHPLHGSDNIRTNPSGILTQSEISKIQYKMVYLILSAIMYLRQFAAKEINTEKG